MVTEAKALIRQAFLGQSKLCFVKANKDYEVDYEINVGFFFPFFFLLQAEYHVAAKASLELLTSIPQPYPHLLFFLDRDLLYSAAGLELTEILSATTLRV